MAVYTGDGYTVTDSYTCGSGSCGGFTITDTYTHAVGAEGAGPSHELAAPVMASTGEVEEAPGAGGHCKTVRATPAHLVMTMHALTLGVVTATSNLISGESDGFVNDFKKTATAGAETVTPVGAHVLNRAFA